MTHIKLDHFMSPKGKINHTLFCFLSPAYSKLCSQLLSPGFTGADSFYVRVNLNMEPHSDPPSLSVSCDDIIHVTDTRYKGKYHWHCSLVDPHTAKHLQKGTMPNYNRYSQPIRFDCCLVLDCILFLTNEDFS